MYGYYFKGALLIGVAVLLALFVEPIIGEQAAIMAMAPGGEETAVYRYATAVGDSLLLFLLLGVVALILAAALVERELGGGV
ncbi:hypothetical protein HPS36_02080 [Halorubrum salinarum]|uniref:Uncharacterized protein n=1 Tax=Halorubrum salinarum TaxID=2739057 RepID=A0A7D4BAC6_9EURY|nr:hypothetical protein [Halorubrum salinarum]QKG91691.1 hypothetical protein HPS36_02080 [Halorubrum salinarum]